jgi:choice-of-anchor C domain-containing protein
MPPDSRRSSRTQLRAVLLSRPHAWRPTRSPTRSMRQLALCGIFAALAGFALACERPLITPPEPAKRPAEAPREALVRSAAAGSNLVQNGSFELPDVPQGHGVDYPAGSAEVAGWTIAAGSIDVDQTWQPGDGLQSIDLSGTAAGTIYQDLATTAGTVYTLSFLLAGNHNPEQTVKTLEIEWGPPNGPTVRREFSFDPAGASPSNMKWRKVIVSDLRATSVTTRLTFRSTTTTGTLWHGPAIDDVIVDPVVFRALLIDNLVEGSTTGINGDLLKTYLDRPRAVGSSSQPAYSSVEVVNQQLTSSAQVRAKIVQFFANADANDLSLVYFASHGEKIPDRAPLGDVEDPGDPFCPHPAICDEGLWHPNGSIFDDELSSMLTAIPQPGAPPSFDGRKIVIIDACFSGGMADDGLRDLGLPSSVVMMTTQSYQLAYFGEGSAGALYFFTAGLLTGIEDNGEGFARADLDRNSIVTVHEAFVHAENELLRILPAKNIPPARQTPRLDDSRGAVDWPFLQYEPGTLSPPAVDRALGVPRSGCRCAGGECGVPNRAPTANPGSPRSGVEGAPISFSGALSSDPDGDPLTYGWDFGDGRTASGLTATHSYVNDGSYTVTLTVTDSRGAGNQAMTAATVANAPPIVGAITAPASAAVNAVVSASTTFGDPGASDGPWSYRFDWGDNTTPMSGQSASPGTISAGHSYAAAGTYSIKATITDKDGGSATTSAVQITISGTGAPGAPVAVANGPYTGKEGTPITVSSAGSNDPEGSALAYLWEFGDGTKSTLANPSKSYADNGTYTVKLTATDPQGLKSTVATTATIANVAPTATFAVPASIDEGSGYTLALGGSDAGAADRTTLQYALDCGRGTGFGPWSATLKSVSCPVMPDQGTLTVQGRVMDKDSAITLYTKPVVVRNAAPVVTFVATSPTSFLVGGSLSVQGSFSDKGVSDGPWQYSIAWGDGTAATTGTLASQGTPITASHTYAKAGTFSASLKVTDKDDKAGTSAVIRGTVGLPPEPASLAAGELHTCALLSTSGQSYCWGGNAEGQLGDGTTAERWTPGAVQQAPAFARVATISNHTCALDASGKAYCWGNNQFGQLGDATTTRRSVPAEVRGGMNFASIVAGSGFTCALAASSSQAYCWGDNRSAQLGTGDYQASVIPQRPVQGGRSFRSISSGIFHTCALDATGKAYCWGFNDSGELGNRTTTSSPSPVAVEQGSLNFTSLAAGGFHNCALTAARQAYCWGDNSFGQVGDSTKTNALVPVQVRGGLSFTKIASGNSQHTCALTAVGKAYCWGRNHFGQLGDGTTTDRQTLVEVRGGLSFTSIMVSFGHTCARSTSGQVYCWGSNSNGQLGDGTTTPRLTPTPVQGGLIVASRRAPVMVSPGEPN